MTQDVRTIAGCEDIQPPKAPADHVPKLLERNKGGVQGQEYFPMVRTGARLAQVPQYRIAHRSRQGQDAGSACLGTVNRPPFDLPVQILQPEASHFAVAQAVYREEHQNRAVADGLRIVASGRGKQALALPP